MTRHAVADKRQAHQSAQRAEPTELWSSTQQLNTGGTTAGTGARRKEAFDAFGANVPLASPEGPSASADEGDVAPILAKTAPAAPAAAEAAALHST